jgi:hypothetical protein
MWYKLVSTIAFFSLFLLVRLQAQEQIFHVKTSDTLSPALSPHSEELIKLMLDLPSGAPESLSNRKSNGVLSNRSMDNYRSIDLWKDFGVNANVLPLYFSDTLPYDLVKSIIIHCSCHGSGDLSRDKDLMSSLSTLRQEICVNNINNETICQYPDLTMILLQ